MTDHCYRLSLVHQFSTDLAP